MPLNRPKDQTGKMIPGTNKIATKGDPLQMKKMRCPGCQQIATVSIDAKGTVATCTCGRTFRSIPF